MLALLVLSNRINPGGSLTTFSRAGTLVKSVATGSALLASCSCLTGPETFSASGEVLGLEDARVLVGVLVLAAIGAGVLVLAAIGACVLAIGVGVLVLDAIGVGVLVLAAIDADVLEGAFPFVGTGKLIRCRGGFERLYAGSRSFGG
jgi:hypothetical protein